MLKGAITALVTPMLTSSEIDFASVKKLVDYQVKNGVQGLVIAGTTGESALLDEAEKLELINYVIKINQGRVKIIVGVSGASTKFTCDYIAQHLNKISGIDFILALTPYYVKPTQDGMYEYFGSVAKVSKYPVILYNVPARTGCDLYNTTVLRLSHDFKNIIGLKDATGVIDRVIELKRLVSEFMVYSGDDETALEFILNGGDGVISVVSNVIPEEFSQMCNLALSNDGDDKLRAQKINKKTIELSQLLFIETNPIPVKWVLFVTGQIMTSFIRSPLTQILKTSQERIQPVLEKIIGKKINAN
jgi:4-hydroxy-tetrahydrodipicolinate synthase